MIKNNTETDNVVWFAVSAPHQRELKAQKLLEGYNIETFIPMRYEVVESTKGKKRILAPAIHNLLFARTSRRLLQQIKTGIPYIQYKTRRENGRNVPIIIPDEQMEQFIAVCSTHDDHLMFLQPEEVNLRKGTRVRILGGAFDGIEGVFVEMKGRRERRVVVLIEGLTAVATAEITPDLIEVLE